MGRQDHVVQAAQGAVRRQRLALEHVEGGRRDAPGADHLDERRLIDHRTPAGVDEDGLRPEAGQALAAHQAARLGVEGHVQRDEVRLGQELVHADRLDAHPAELVGRPVVVVADDAQAQPEAASRDGAPDPPHADDAQRPAHHAMDRERAVVGIATRGHADVEPGTWRPVASRSAIACSATSSVP